MKEFRGPYAEQTPKEKRNSCVFQMIIAVFFVVLSMMGVGVNIHRDRKADHLEKVCTETTIGQICRFGSTGSGKSSGKDYIEAEFEVNGVRYTTVGTDRSVWELNTPYKMGSDVKVCYNPSDPKDAYTGDGPVRENMSDNITGFVGIILGSMWIVFCLRSIRDQNVEINRIK